MLFNLLIIFILNLFELVLFMFLRSTINVDFSFLSFSCNHCFRQRHVSSQRPVAHLSFDPSLVGRETAGGVTTASKPAALCRLSSNCHRPAGAGRCRTSRWTRVGKADTGFYVNKMVGCSSGRSTTVPHPLGLCPLGAGTWQFQSSSWTFQTQTEGKWNFRGNWEKYIAVFLSSRRIQRYTF